MQAHSKRRGMTLIELLVVIAIIAILGGLISAGIISWVASQAQRNTEAAMRAIHLGLMAHWNAVIEEASKEPLPPPNVWPNAVNYPTDVFDWAKDSSGSTTNKNVRDRARAIWIKLRLMEAFPVNFQEIVNAYQPTLPPNALPSKVIWKSPLVLIPTNRRRYMVQYQKGLTNVIAAKHQAKTESGACLLMALNLRRNGVQFDADTLRPYTGDLDADLIPEFVDNFNQPLRFYRFATNHTYTGSGVQHLSLQDFGKQQLAPATTNFDPLDRNGLLLLANWDTTRSAIYDQWIHARLNGNTEAWYAVPVIVSGGRDEVLGLTPNTALVQDDVPSPNPSEYVPVPGTAPYQAMQPITSGLNPPGPNQFEIDNIYSYMLNK